MRKYIEDVIALFKITDTQGNDIDPQSLQLEKKEGYYYLGAEKELIIGSDASAFESLSHSIVFQNFIFKEAIILEALSNSRFSFYNCTFKQDFRMSQIVFNDDVVIHKCHFEGVVVFHNVRFKKIFQFTYCTFSKEEDCFNIVCEYFFNSEGSRFKNKDSLKGIKLDCSSHLKRLLS